MKFYYNPDVKIPACEYPIERFMKFEEDTYDVLGSVFLETLQNTVSQSSEVRVLDDECRFDNIAYEFMTSQDYWWVLMEFNNFIDWDLRTTNVLKIPFVPDLLRKEQEHLIQSNLEKMDR
jgi:hypothetical protein